MYDVDVITTLVVYVEALSKKIDGLSIIKQPTPMMHCDLCGWGHGSQECQAIKSLVRPSKHVNYMGNTTWP